MTAPLALTVHDGTTDLPEHLREIVPAWLRANRINPDQVSGQHPIHILTLPYQPPAGEEGWLVQVIVFHQYYVGPDGEQEKNLLTGRLACFERTVPLTVAFPSLETASSQPGGADGEAEEAPEPVGQEEAPEMMPEPEAGGAR